MIELSFLISIILFTIYMKKKGFKPSKDYIGDESGLVDRANKVVYYNILNNFTTIVFPFFIVINTFARFLNKSIEIKGNIFTNLLISIISIIIFTLVISKTYTKYTVNKAKKRNNLRRYIGGMWLDTSI